MKTKLVKICIYILSLLLIVSYFVFNVFKLNETNYTMIKATADNWYFIFVIIVPAILPFTEGFIKNDLKYIANIILVIIGLILCLLMNVKDSHMLYGWYIYIGLYFALGIISGIRLSGARKKMIIREQALSKEESKKFESEMLKNDKFKK